MLKFLPKCFGMVLLVVAGIVQLVERLLAKEEVVGPSPIARSVTFNKRLRADNLH